MRKNRFMVGFAAIAAMGMVLAGCGSKSSSDKKANSDEPITITYVHRLPDGDGMVLVKDIVARWNKEHPKIQVKATKFPGKSNELAKKLVEDVKSGNAPDIAQFGYAEFPENYVNGIFQDVTKYADKYKGNYVESAFKLVQFDGKTYGLPQDTGPLVYYYNKAEFEKLGIKLPTNKDELLTAAKTAAEKGKYIMAYEPDEVAGIIGGLAGASASWYKVDGDKWKVDTNTSGSKAVAEVFQSLLDSKSAFISQRWASSFDAGLKEGKLIGTVGAAWEAPLLTGSLGGVGKGEWRVAQVGDWFGNGKKTGPDGGSGLAILKTSKHPAEAIEFANWFNTQLDDLTTQGLVLAATTGAQTTPKAWAEYYGGQDIMKEFATASANMGDFTFIPGWSAVMAAMAEAGGHAGDNSGKVADIFTAAQKSSIDALKSYGLKVDE